MSQRVLVLGGGVSGMTVAHELSERGFEVTVLEWNTEIAGGKARSEPAGLDAKGPKPLPGEHGFRFFPGFYKHVPDTMKRIPFEDQPHGVYDNIHSVEEGVFAPFDGPPFDTPIRFPRSLSELEVAFEMPEHLAQLGLKLGDFEFFAGKMLQVMTSCNERRLGEYEKTSWWKFVDAGSRSPAYQKYLAIGPTRNAVATQAKLASARTIGDIGVQLLLNMTTPGETADRVLNGPTSVKWLEPWRELLTGRYGVDYQLGRTVTEVRFSAETGRVTGVSAVPTRDPHSEPDLFTADVYVCALPVEITAGLLPAELISYDETHGGLLGGLASLKDSVQWMVGMQFYLTYDAPLAPGHINCIDTPWALTAISETQFWPSTHMPDHGDGTIKTIVSIDISDWDTPGIEVKKPARDCTHDEIAREAWFQLRKSMNTEEGGPLSDFASYHICSRLEEREKQGQERLLEEDMEPLLVNQKDTWKSRPESATQVKNLFLAGDYVRTYTDFASMEAANESGRRAANAILDLVDSPAERCGVWPLHEPSIFAPLRQRDLERWRAGKSWNLPWYLHLLAAFRPIRWVKKLIRNVTTWLLNSWMLKVLLWLKDALFHLLGKKTLSDVVKEVLAQDNGRIPVPPGQWMSYQQWEMPFFCNWQIEPEALRDRIPEELEIDTFDGKAWVTLVPSHFSHVGFPLFGSIPGEGEFLNMNLRTYVNYKGLRGVCFFAIDANRRLVDLVAKLEFLMPYHYSKMTLDSTPSGHRIVSRRQRGEAAFVGEFAPKGEIFQPQEGSLFHFLLERYTVFAKSPGGELFRSDLVHVPWDIQEVDATLTENTVLKASGLSQLDPLRPTNFIYSPGTAAVLWGLRKLE